MKKILLLCVVLCCTIFKPTAQDTELWFVAPDASDRLCCDHPVFLVISNPSENLATVEVWIEGGATLKGTYYIPGGQAEKITWTSDTEVRTLIENPIANAGTVTSKGIRILVTQGEGVLAYYQMDGQGSKDLFSLKGKHALGNEFYIPMMYDSYYPINWGAYSQIDIVAAEDCQIRFTPTQDCMIAGSTSFYQAGVEAGPITLLKGETFKLIDSIQPIIEPKGSGLAGTHIISDTPNSIAVTVTEDAADSNGAQDIIGDQIVPTAYTGRRYVVVKGHTGKGYPTTDRIYFTASTAGGDVRVYGDGGWPMQTVTLSGAGDTKVVDIGNDSGSGLPNAVYIESDNPVYCYHVSGAGRELGSALIPSMFSITQQELAFYAKNMSGNGADINEILLVFRDTCENYFEISNGGSFTRLSSLTPVVANPVPGPIVGSITWCWAKVTLPAGYRDDNMITIRNSESTFSLGYFNGDDGTSSYGYISGFGDWSLPYDTLWRCAGSNSRFTLSGGYALSYDWEFPDGTHSNDAAITLRDTGRYIIDMDVDYKHIYDTVYLYEITLDPQIERIPKKPAKVGIPQLFTATSYANVPNTKYYWTFEGGNPATSTAANPLVTWNSTGKKKVTLTVEVEAGSGDTKAICEKTVTLDLVVRPRNNGYFVNQNVGGGLQDGSDWKNAFYTIQEALNLASQGDYIWVAQGTYSPFSDDTYLIDHDSVQIYGGFGGWEERLGERKPYANPTILKGNGNSVVTFDGSTRYLNYPSTHPCGLSTETVLDGFTIQNGRTKNGAGILFTNGGTATISNCVIRQNTASEKGGGLYLVSPGCNQADPIFVNLEISGNTALQGAGIYNDASSFTATNITVGGNKANKGGGLYNAGGNPDIRNTIIWGNRDASTDEKLMDITISSGTPGYTYSDIGGSNGSGSGWNTALGIDRLKNIDIKPFYRQKGFDDNGNMLNEGNYRLSVSSKAVNTGSNIFIYTGNHLLRDITLVEPKDRVVTGSILGDLDGYGRINEDIVDMGAYEFYNEDDSIYIQRKILIPEHPYLTTDPTSGEHYIKSREDFTLTLFPKEGYSLDYLDIKTGSIYQDELGYKKIIRNEDGSVTVIFHQVIQPLDIQINGVSPVANEAIESSYALWSSDNQLHIQTTNIGTLKIYSITGSLVKQQELPIGDTTISLTQGIYIVTFNNGLQQKVVVK